MVDARGWGWKGLVVLGMLLLVVACQGPVDEPAMDSTAAIGPTGEVVVEGQSLTATGVEFETIERTDRLTGNRAEAPWSSPSPGVAVIGRVEEVEALGNTISAEAQAQLRSLDYGEKFAMVVFLGHQPNIEEIMIERVLDWGEHLTLQGRVPVYELSDTAESSPYHIISLRREWVWREPLRFDLWIDGTDAVVGMYPPVLSETTPVPTATSPYTPTATGTPTQTATPWTTFTPPAPGTPWPPGYPPPGATPYENSTLTPYPAVTPTKGTPERIVD